MKSQREIGNPFTDLAIAAKPRPKADPRRALWVDAGSPRPEFIDHSKYNPAKLKRAINERRIRERGVCL